MKISHSAKLAASLVIMATLVGCSAAKWQVKYENATGVPLDYCVVATDPPPPHRVCNRTLQAGLVADISPVDFNPAIYDPTSKLGALVQMDLGGSPPVVLVRRIQFKVQPGLEGSDPAMQPMVLEDLYLEADPMGVKVIEIYAGPIDIGHPMTVKQRTKP